MDTHHYTFVQPVNPKGNQPWIFTGRTDDEAETPIFWPPDMNKWLIGKDPDAGGNCGQEEKGATEDETVGWHHQVNGHEFEQTLGVGDGQEAWRAAISGVTEGGTWLDHWRTTTVDCTRASLGLSGTCGTCNAGDKGLCVPSLCWEDPMEEGKATHSSILVWEIPWTEEPGGPQSVGLHESDTTEWLNHHYHELYNVRRGPDQLMLYLLAMTFWRLFLPLPLLFLSHLSCYKLIPCMLHDFLNHLSILFWQFSSYWWGNFFIVVVVLAAFISSFKSCAHFYNRTLCFSYLFVEDFYILKIFFILKNNIKILSF